MNMKKIKKKCRALIRDGEITLLDEFGESVTYYDDTFYTALDAKDMEALEADALVLYTDWDDKAKDYKDKKDK